MYKLGDSGAKRVLNGRYWTTPTRCPGGLVRGRQTRMMDSLSWFIAHVLGLASLAAI